MPVGTLAGIVLEGICDMWDTQSDVFLGAASSRGRSAPQGLALWEFDGQNWILKTVESRNGGVPGDPPQVAGRFKGQLRATPCVEPITA